MIFETIIGLEIHVELLTKSKIFCSCSTEFGADPNENTCPVCTGLPGTLPVLNEEAVDLAIRAGKALNCDINVINKFDRKNYFYPDLPKAYQISQFDLPICEKGYVDIEVEGQKKTIHITRIHMEEDAGKLMHLEEEATTLVDYNRTGVPLIEIVTEPDLRSPEEAVEFLKNLKEILEYTDISDCRMEQGSLRCDANISLRQAGTEKLNTRVEIKNLNSFKEILKALKKEEKRQQELYLYGEGHKIQQETRKWDAAKGKTVAMRSKEESHDYRYFPEPDLPPVIIDQHKIEEIGATLPELPAEKRARFIEKYGVQKMQVDILVAKKELADYFEKVVALGAIPIEAANWITVDMLRLLKDEEETQEVPLKPEYIVQLLKLIDEGKVSRTAAKEVLEELWGTDKTPDQVVQEKGLNQISGTEELEKIVIDIISKYPQAVEDYKNGKAQAVGYLMGQIMKATSGKANPQMVKEIIVNKLNDFKI
ncbi:aspartyl/glutamyl-tRNA(Asn/Gln) amidotransferase subunit B [Clostridium aceticum]|uniref:Aspartyl/glutamyl-tRNA(Asn/Gln) amidotransferase subunit B n=1 Tax=Clostridium aceticum TaxID=84022 RepID=A0A0D8IBF4_9CLOT|nr:Asp-tRNA(Asn)/Glu-tRNA(Gln) amidotransferase subunit GatB [Clostridium aceticum]AKL95860.1 aspartyl/glutamyl-tRNA(Asn/Gln) amidotransferase subunit B [Clostridium aceticum]KJF26551.1 glutamyl-tRNA amidotransferase [Clostridium aceticum]